MSRAHAALAAILTFFLATEALAHGGMYRLPRIPGPRTPPGGLPTPTPPGGNPGTPTPGIPRPGGGLGGGRTIRPAPVPQSDPADWTSWWIYNGERYLQVRRTVEARRTTTGEESPVEETWRDEAIAALLEALGHRHEDISTGAALALGKSGDARAREPLGEVLRRRQSHRTLREAAALGLGLLGNEEGRAQLTDVLLDRGEPSRLRAFAAYGLALARSPAAVPGLASVIRNPREETDPRAAALLAAGQLGDEVLAPVVQEAAVRPAAGLSPWERACAVTALGRIEGAEAIPILLKAAARGDDHVRRSAVLALGRVREGDEKKAFGALTYLAKTDGDRVTRAYATIALARTRRPEASVTLLRIAEIAKNTSHRGFALLALGVLARECEDDALSEKVGAFLRRGLENGKLSLDLEGAVVTALGVMRDRASVPALLEMIERKGSPELRGQVAIALAMIGDRDALPALRAALDPKGETGMLRAVALALGLLGDSESTRRLVDLVRDAKSEWVRGNAALALGRIGGPAAARAMIEVLTDEHTSGPTRGMAAVALGRMLDRREIPALVTLVEDLDYQLPLESLRELLTIL